MSAGVSPRRASLLLSLSIVVIAGAAQATSFATTRLVELAEMADVVVRVRVTRAEPRWLEEQGPSRIVTFHEVRLLEVVRGHVRDEEARAGALIVGVPGGVLGDVGQRVAGAPTLEVGHDYVLLLGRAEGPGGARGIAGLRYGVIDAGPRLGPVERARLDDALPLLRGAVRHGGTLP